MNNAAVSDKSILIKNDTSDAKVTLFIYPTWDPICWLSSSSKIIEPGKKYLYRSEDSFKFELRAHGDKSKRKIIHSLTEWEKAAVFIVTGRIEDSEKDSNVKVEEKNLSDFPQENLICIRRQNMEKEISADCGRNLYEILKLNIKDVRKEKELEKQNEMIKKAYHREMRRWHPDRPEGDENMCQEIIFAYSILSDPEQRAKYNNVADYDNGWLSKSRWKSIFFPDCNSEEQRSQRRKRIALMIVSLLLAVGGVALTVLTGGLAAPITIACSVASGAMIGAGIQSGLRTITRESIENGCDTNKYLTSMAIGGIAGALVGGAAAGITAGMVGVGSAALQATEVTMGQYIGVGAATGAAGGAISSVAADLEKKFVDGEDISWKKIAGHAAIGMVIGAAAGVAGGAVTKAVAGPAMSASAANLDGEAIEQIAIRSAASKGTFLVKHAAKLGSMAQGITGSALETAAIVTEERQNNSVENKSLGEHGSCAAQKCLTHVGKSATILAAKETGDACTGNGTDPCTTNSKLEQSEVDKDEVNLTKTKNTLPKTNSQMRNSDQKFELPVTYSIELACNHSQEEQYYEDANIGAPTHIDPDADPNPNDGANGETVGRIRYISEGDWISKLIVQYTNDENEEEKKEVSESGSSIVIPEKAKNIEVRFQILRFINTWCDVKKYDRFQKCWCEPVEPHIFKYAKPLIRTFTIKGGLYYEAVMKVTDEHYNDVRDM